jgi:hypothetical protein
MFFGPLNMQELSHLLRLTDFLNELLGNNILDSQHLLVLLFSQFTHGAKFQCYLNFI